MGNTFKPGDTVKWKCDNQLYTVIEQFGSCVRITPAKGGDGIVWTGYAGNLELVQPRVDAIEVSPNATFVREPGLPHSAKARKATPVATGVLGYFPDAIAEVAKTSYIGNEQHNPGQPLHWARGKSTDQLDAAVRHIMDYLKGNRQDALENYVLAQAAWRILAQLQLDIEAEKGGDK